MLANSRKQVKVSRHADSIFDKFVNGPVDLPELRRFVLLGHSERKAGMVEAQTKAAKLTITFREYLFPPVFLTPASAVATLSLNYSLSFLV
jgi:hypothetical protein